MVYAFKVSQLKQLEQLSQQGQIDLFYGDESRICSEGYVPYGWQFKGENVHIAVQKGYKINIWGLITRDNRIHWATTEHNIDAKFVFDQLERLSLTLSKPTVVVLDNAKIHSAQLIQRQKRYWQDRGLFVFYLPPYSPHLNIAETLWRIMKTKQIDAEHYLDKETLFYYTNRCLASFGDEWEIHFAPFNIN